METLLKPFKNLAIIFGGTWNFGFIAQTIYQFAWLGFKLYLLYLVLTLAVIPYADYTKEVSLYQQFQQLNAIKK
jgi:hypothetical protein